MKKIITLSMLALVLSGCATKEIVRVEKVEVPVPVRHGVEDQRMLEFLAAKMNGFYCQPGYTEWVDDSQVYLCKRFDGAMIMLEAKRTPDGKGYNFRVLKQEGIGEDV